MQMLPQKLKFKESEKAATRKGSQINTLEAKRNNVASDENVCVLPWF